MLQCIADYGPNRYRSGEHMTTTIQQVPTGTYGLDPVHARFGFGVKYNGLSTFRSSSRSRRELADGVLTGSADVALDHDRRAPTFKDHLLADGLLQRRDHADRHLPLDRHPAQRGRHRRGRRRAHDPRVTKPVIATGNFGAGVDPFGNERVGSSWRRRRPPRVRPQLADAAPDGDDALAWDVTLPSDLAARKQA